MRYEVWRSPVSQIYSTSILSRATIFTILATLLTIIPPLLIAYRSQGFWMRTSTYREQPDFHFKHELILVATTSAGDQLGWSTYNPVNNFLMDNVRIPVIKSREEDTNRDGLNDMLDMEIRMPVQQDEEVVSVSLLLLFDVNLYKYSIMRMTGLVYINSGGWVGSGVNVVGDMKIVQKQPLAHRGRDNRYLNSPINSDSENPEDFFISTILQNYASRNVSIKLENCYDHWLTGRGTQFFTIQAKLHYPEQMLTYTPGFWQVIKWGWVQYLSILLVFMFLFSGVKDFVFTQQILPTLVSRNDK